MYRSAYNPERFGLPYRSGVYVGHPLYPPNMVASNLMAREQHVLTKENAHLQNRAHGLANNLAQEQDLRVST